MEICYPPILVLPPEAIIVLHLIIVHDNQQDSVDLYKGLIQILLMRWLGNTNFPARPGTGASVEGEKLLGPATTFTRVGCVFATWAGNYIY